MLRALAARLLGAGAFAVLLTIVAPASAGRVLAAAPSPAPSYDVYAQAQEYFHAGKFKDAVSLLDAWNATPTNARALVLRGDAKAELGDDEGALKDYNAAIGIAPDYQYAYETRCETRLALNDAAGALTDCNMAVKLDATDAKAYEDRADVYFERDAYSDAAQDYKKAIELGRHTAYVYAASCDAERLTGKLADAAKDCEKALTIDPKSRRGQWARGRLAIVNKLYPQALGYLNSYILQDSEHSTAAYYFRGYVYNRLRNYRNAFDDLNTYVGRAPDDPDGYTERALARFGLGNKDAALADLSIAAHDYSKDGDTAGAQRVTALADAMRGGGAVTPP